MTPSTRARVPPLVAIALGVSLSGCGTSGEGATSASASAKPSAAPTVSATISSAPTASARPSAAPSASAAGPACAGSRCRECAREAGCSWKTKERTCVSGDAGCRASACVTRENDCPPE